MNKVLANFLERLVERMTALVAGLVSSSVAEMHAEAQALQQSRLEDLARQYEADGKPEIALTLRKRSTRLASADLAGEGTEVVHLTMVPLQDPETGGEPADLRSLPDFSGQTKRRSRAVTRRDEPAIETEESSS